MSPVHNKPAAANAPYRLPPPLFDARCKACWFTLAVLALLVASFWTLELKWSQFLSLEAARSMARFGAEFFPPDLSAPFAAPWYWALWARAGCGSRWTIP